MGILQALKDELNLRVIIAVLILFYLINVNAYIGFAYGLFWFFDWNIEQDRRFPSFLTVSGEIKVFSVLFLIIVTFGGFLLSASLIAAIFQPGINSVQGLLAFMAQESAPLFAKNPFFNFFGVGVIGPIVETRAFWRFTEWLLWNFKQPMVFEILNPKIWIAVLLVASGFSLFHLTAKLSSDAALFVTFLFWVVSSWVILFSKRLLEGKFLHIFNNSLVQAVKQGFLRI